MTGRTLDRPLRRGVRRPRQHATRHGRRHPRPAARRARAGAHRRDARHRRDDPGRAGRRHPRRRSTPAWWCRAGRARARPRSACTAPRSCSTSTASRSTRAACSWSARTRCSCATSPRCLPSLGETSVVQTTVRAAASARRAPCADEPPGVGAVKGDARMAEVIRSALPGPPAAAYRRPRGVDSLGAGAASPGDRCSEVDGRSSLATLPRRSVGSSIADAFRAAVVGLILDGLERVRRRVLATRERSRKTSATTARQAARSTASGRRSARPRWCASSSPAVPRSLVRRKASSTRTSRG